MCNGSQNSRIGSYYGFWVTDRIIFRIGNCSRCCTHMNLSFFMKQIKLWCLYNLFLYKEFEWDVLGVTPSLDLTSLYAGFTDLMSQETPSVSCVSVLLLCYLNLHKFLWWLITYKRISFLLFENKPQNEWFSRLKLVYSKHDNLVSMTLFLRVEAGRWKQTWRLSSVSLKVYDVALIGTCSPATIKGFLLSTASLMLS